MSYYAIGIGGTGAKCIESLIHIAAAGLLPERHELYTLFVDPDGSNGNLGRATSLLNCYTECRENIITETDVDFLKTRIEIADPDVWSPLSGGVNQLDNYFSYHSLNTASEEAAHLFNILYSPEEKETSLDKGFRGHPSIGAAVMATSVDLDGVEPWQTFWESIQQDLGEGSEVKIVLFGSIFGGTGASGFPTIARLLRNRFNQKKFKEYKTQNIRLGGVLMLPYFSFDSVRANEMKADSQDFLLNTQSALQYYYQQSEIDQNEASVFDFTYLVGCQEQRPMRVSSLGGSTQENDPHFAEIYAALAAVDFFSTKNFDNSNRPYNLIARTKQTGLQWVDLPFSNQTDLKNNVLHLVRFSFAYLSIYYPMLQSIAASGKSYRAPWYMDFFEFKNVNVRDRLEKELKHVKEYCQSYLLWLANLEYSITGTVGTTNLVNFSPFAYVKKDEKGKDKIFLREENNKNNFDPESFGNILLPGMKENESSLSHLWDRMCEAYPKLNEQNAWSFLNELYRQCGYVKNKEISTQ